MTLYTFCPKAYVSGWTTKSITLHFELAVLKILESHCLEIVKNFTCKNNSINLNTLQNNVGNF